MKKTTAITALALSATLLLAGCGGSDDELASLAGSSTPSTSATTAASDPASTGSATPDPSSVSATPAAVDGGTLYKDPKKKFTITIADAWKKESGKSPSWQVAKASPFPASIALDTEDLTGADGVDADEYMKQSAKGLKQAGFTVVKMAVIQGSNTPMVGAIEYTGTLPGTKIKAHFLVVLDMKEGDVAALATLITPEASYKKIRAQVLPYMRSIVVL